MRHSLYDTVMPMLIRVYHTTFPSSKTTSAANVLENTYKLHHTYVQASPYSLFSSIINHTPYRHHYERNHLQLMVQYK